MISIPEVADHASVQTNVGFSALWLQVISHLDPARGGMSAVVPRLASEIAARSGIRSELGIFNGSGEAGNTPAGLMASSWPARRSKWMSSPTLKREFERELRRVDGVHIHGLWESSTTVAARTARRLGKPYVISAHGMLEPWALRNKGAKKRIYAVLIEKANLNRAACLHALTRAEAEDYRRFGCTAPIAVIPNGVDSPIASSALFFSKFKELEDRKIVLFLGRIHFKKGLDLLIPAWAAAAQLHPDATLVLAGPDSESSFKAVAELIAQHGLAHRIVCTGMLDETMKWSALAAASCFVLPSYSEGLSVAVLEAMSMGVPVIVSEQCYMPEVATSGAGLVVSTTVAAVAEAVRCVLSADASTLAQMGARGQALVKEKYSWRVVAEKMAQLYTWVAGGARPAVFDIEEVRR